MPAPTNPAPVGLPGALSVRTDGGPSDTQPIRSLPGADYGDGQAFEDAQHVAPAYQEPSAPPLPHPGGMFDDTRHPDEPVTAGIASGPGTGPEGSVYQKQSKSDTDILKSYLPALRAGANSSRAPKSFKLFVQYLESIDAG